MTNSVVYLHGLNSSQHALKAQQTERYLAAEYPEMRFISPQIPNLPERALPFLETFFKQLAAENIYIIGSSLGGLYARYFAEQLKCKAVLINPLIFTESLKQRYQGQHINPYTQEHYCLSQQSFVALQTMADKPLQQAENFFILLQMADEVLDANLASQFYSSCRSLIQPQGNHRFENYQQVLPAVIGWFLME